MVRFFLQHKLTIFSALGIFILALLPRTLGLGVFLTVDEQVWWENTKNFAGGIIDPHFACPGVTENDAAVVLAPTTGLACTLRAAHPGVTTMWNGSLGIWLYYLSTDTSQSLVEFVQQLGVHPIDKDSIVWLRLPTALLSELFPVLVFLILLKILSDEPASSYWLALIAAIFIALSPFNIALSRVLHTDATETIFLTLALLTALYYWLRRPSRRWLLLSGALGGASFLSKNPALFLCPFIILIEVWYLGKLWFAEYRGKKIVKAGFEVVLEGLLWFSAEGSEHQEDLPGALHGR